MHVNMGFVFIIVAFVCNSRTLRLRIRLRQFVATNVYEDSSRENCECDIFRFSELIESIDTCRIAEPITE